MCKFRPIYKKVDLFDKNNYRPLSILPLLPKVYERLTYERAPNYFPPFAMKFFVGLEKHIVRSMLYLNY